MQEESLGTNPPSSTYRGRPLWYWPLVAILTSLLIITIERVALFDRNYTFESPAGIVVEGRFASDWGTIRRSYQQEQDRLSDPAFGDLARRSGSGTITVNYSELDFGSSSFKDGALTYFAAFIGAYHQIRKDLKIIDVSNGTMDGQVSNGMRYYEKIVTLKSVDRDKIEYRVIQARFIQDQNSELVVAIIGTAFLGSSHSAADHAQALKEMRPGFNVQVTFPKVDQNEAPRDREPADQELTDPRTMA